MQSNEDREQPCEDITNSLPVYTTPDADVTRGGEAAGVGGGAGERPTVGGGVGSRGGFGGDPSRRRASDGGSVTRKNKKNEVGGAVRLHQALDEITEVMRTQGTINEPPG